MERPKATLDVFDYIRSPSLRSHERAICLMVAVECGKHPDEDRFIVSDSWIERTHAAFADELPGLDVGRVIGRHLGAVVVFGGPWQQTAPSAPPGERRARKPLSARASLEVFAKNGYQCVACGGRDDLTVDHVVPVVRGGTNAPDNLQTLCRPCNSRKGAQV